MICSGVFSIGRIGLFGGATAFAVLALLRARLLKLFTVSLPIAVATPTATFDAFLISFLTSSNFCPKI